MTDLSDDDTLVETSGKGCANGRRNESRMPRVRKDLKTLTATEKEALNTLAIAGTIVGASFVILDVIDHDWVAIRGMS